MAALRRLEPGQPIAQRSDQERWAPRSAALYWHQSRPQSGDIARNDALVGTQIVSTLVFQNLTRLGSLISHRQQSMRPWPLT